MCVLDEQKLIDDAFNLAHKTSDEIIKTLESGAYRPAEKIILEKYLQKFIMLDRGLKLERRKYVPAN